MASWNVKAATAVRKFKGRLDRRKSHHSISEVASAMRGHSRFDHDQIFLKDRCANFKAKEDDAGGAGDANGGSGSAAVTSPTTQRTPVDEDSM